MNPGNFPPNPYGNGAGGPPQMYSGNYRSQRPRFQQNNQGFRSPSYNNNNNNRQGFIPFGRSPRPYSPGNYNSPGASPRHSSPYHQSHSPQWKSSPRGRGGSNSFSNSSSSKDCNPGGSDNISDYYHPSMAEDPWKDCSPVYIEHHFNSSK